ncbi:Mu-like prophage major head subunit gpT family protein [Sandaracinus amylolyticus]|uniref:Mu-like prophage major head subunit gpT family protein n=1 Tax=Sandaracinus amylolyticus TaxID=927083 RepID=UPI001F189D98|nr:Mu-like prophage major head subunit gpT family protein [Sandaracinus amylolyticus]UJR81484.1 Putative major head subunit protein [Sandaracinus amylolyticus]
MAITNYATNYAAATTAFHQGFEELFNRQRTPLFSMICEEVPVTGLTLEAPFLGDDSPVRKWIGSKRFQDLRSFRQSYPVEPYEKSLRIPALNVRHDSSGAIARRISAFLQSVVSYFDKPVFDMLMSNPVGFDGVALCSTSHPFGPNGGVQSNKSNNPLSHSEYRAALKTMGGWLSENGEPLEMSGTVLLVGTDQEDIALEVAGVDKPVNVGQTGTLDANANVVGVTTVKNVFQGRTTVIVSPRVSATKWAVLDMSKPGLAPLVIGVARKPEAIAMDKPDSPARFERDDWEGSIEADFALGAGVWPTLFGNL